MDFRNNSNLDSSYLTLADFTHIFLFIKKNLIFCFVFIISLAISFFNKSLSHQQRLSQHWLYYTIFLICLYPNKHPFFLTVLIPFFSLYIVSKSEHLHHLLRGIGGENLFFILLFLVTLSLSISAYKHTSLLYQHNNNSEQSQLFSSTENYLETYKINTYYDSVGSLPRKNFISGFIGHSQSSLNEDTFNLVKEKKPDLIFYSAKLALIRDSVVHFLYQNYQPLGLDIWCRSQKMYFRKENYFEKKINQERYYGIPTSEISEKLKGQRINVFNFRLPPHKNPMIEKSLYIGNFEHQEPLKYEASKKQMASKNMFIFIPYDVEELRLCPSPNFSTEKKLGFNRLLRFDSKF